MAILVDEAIWEWRGRRWAHLISDRDLGELHAFAADLGLRRVSFQGDHYDVETSTRERAMTLGASAITSRELVRRLRAAGLRYRGSAAWVQSASAQFDDFAPLAAFVEDTLLGHPDASELLALLSREHHRLIANPITVLHRSFECAVIVETTNGPVDLVAGERHSGPPR